MNLLLLVFAAASCYAAWMSLALGMSAHWRQTVWLSRRWPLPPARLLRGLATGLGALSLLLCLWADGAAFGSLLWGCFVCVTGWVSVFTLS